MARKKVKLAFITNSSARKATYKKRKKGLLKKVSELSTLCGINACMIMYSPYESGPEVWPSVSGAQNVLAEFRHMPKPAQSRKMMNQESFLRQRLDKVNEHLMKQKRENRQKEITHIMFEILNGKGLHMNLNVKDMDDLMWVITQKLKKINEKKEALEIEDATARVTANRIQRDGSESALRIKMEPVQMQNPHVSRMVNAQDRSSLSQRMSMLPFVNSIDLNHCFSAFFP